MDIILFTAISKLILGAAKLEGIKNNRKRL